MTNPNALTILFIALGVYALALLAFGIIGFRKRDKENIVDYFTGGRAFGSYVVIFTFWAGLFSAFTFIGLPGFFYTHGIGTWAFLVFGDILMVLTIFFLGKKIWEQSKRSGAVSPVEMMVGHYQSKVVTLLSVVTTFIFTLPLIAVQIAGIGKLINGITGGVVSVIAASAVMLIFVFIYSSIGGVRSVAWTDALQGSLMLIVFFTVAISFLHIQWDGSLSALFADLSTSGKVALLSIPGPAGFFSTITLISFFFLFIVGPISTPYLAHRLLIFKNTKTIKHLIITFPILVFLITIPAAIIGLGAASIFPSLPSGDMAISEVLKLFANPIIPVLAVVGIVAAAMSTTDSQLLAMSSILSRDIYRGFINPKVSPRSELRLTHVFILLAGALAFFISVHPPKLIVELGILSIAGMAQLAPAYIAGLIWKNATKEGAIASIIGGVGTFLIFQYVVTPWFGFHPGFLGLVIGSLLVVSVSWYFTRRARENVVTATY